MGAVQRGRIYAHAFLLSRRARFADSIAQMPTNAVPENRRILIVDDNAQVHEDFKKTLLGGATEQKLSAVEDALFGESSSQPAQQRNSYQIDSAFQGQEALEKVRQAKATGKPYALIFMDMRMPPGWDGLETIQKIWSEDPKIEIAICSAYSDYPWDEIVSHLGITDRLLFLKKPFEMVEVQQMALALVQKWNLARRNEAHLSELEGLVLERTHSVTAAVQTLFLPANLTFAFDRVSGIGSYRPTLLCGGDWWWYGKRPNGKILAVVADVTGHGPLAAMVTGVIASMFSALGSDQAFSVPHILDKLNGTIGGFCKEKYFATISVLEMDSNDGSYTYYNGGGMPLIIKKATGETSTVSLSGRPLGYLNSFEPHSSSGTFAAGDRFLLFTDGITDDEKLTVPLGFKRWLDLFVSTGGMPLERAKATIEEFLMARGQQAVDDQTFIILECS